MLLWITKRETIKKHQSAAALSLFQQQKHQTIVPQVYLHTSQPTKASNQSFQEKMKTTTPKANLSTTSSSSTSHDFIVTCDATDFKIKKPTPPIKLPFSYKSSSLASSQTIIMHENILKKKSA